MATEQAGNLVLAAALRGLGWSAGRLADRVNAVLGAGFVGRSTVSDWVCRGRVPRHPLPSVVAHIVSDALGREISVADLWQGRASASVVWVPAGAGLDLPWTAAGTVGVLDDWLRHAGSAIGMDRRKFLAVSGVALTASAWAYTDATAAGRGSLAALADTRQSLTVSSAMVDAIAATTAGLRNLGDVEGAEDDNLRFVHHHLSYVARLLREARFSSAKVADRLLAEWAELSQLAGWMAHDAGQHGLSQRYFQSGLHAAHTAGDRSVGTYLLACMSGCAVHTGRLDDGVELGRAARDAVQLANAAHEVGKAAPPTVRALAASRYALAQAAIGDARGYHAAADDARALLGAPGALDGRPDYLSWFGPDKLEGYLAQGALTLVSVTGRDRDGLLDGADEVLGASGASAATAGRAAVFNAAWLARAQVAAGDLDRAAHAGRIALRRRAGVRSRRCGLILQRLTEDLAALPPARQPAPIRELNDQLRSTRVA